jgi:hypothetical protein
MDKWEDCPIKVLGIAPLIMVTLRTVSSFSSGGVMAGPRRPPPLVVASFNKSDPPNKWSLSSPSSLACGWPLGRMAPSLYEWRRLHGSMVASSSHSRNGAEPTQEWARPTDRGPSRPGSVAPSLPWVLLTFCTLSPPIASIWRHHPHVHDIWSSHMKFGLLRFNPRGCSFVTLRYSPPLGVISSCSRTRTRLLIYSFERVVTLSFLSMFSCKNITLPNAHTKIRRWTCYIISVPSGGLVP